MENRKLLFLLPLLLSGCVTVFGLSDAPVLNKIAFLEDRRCEATAIRPFLIHESALVRHRAALALARLDKPDAFPLIANRLEVERDPRVMEMLIFALGQIENQKAIPLLRVLKGHENEGIRAAAIEALGKLKDPTQTSAIVEVLNNDSSSLVRAEACLALFRLGTWRENLSKALPPEVLKTRTDALTSTLISDPSAEVRWRAAYALSEIQDPAAATALIDAMDDLNVWVRTFSARALGTLTPTDKSGIQDALIGGSESRDWPLAVESVKSLKNFNDLRTAVRLIQLLSPGVTNTHVRAAAARTLGFITDGEESTVKALRQAAYDFSLAVEGEAIVGLGALGALTSNGPFLEHILNHQNPHLRAKAAEAAALMKEDGVDTLIELAEDRSVKVRVQALDGLKLFPQYPDEIVPLAEDALTYNDMALSYAAADLLGAFEARDSVPLLKKAYVLSRSPSAENGETRLKLLETIIALEQPIDETFLWGAFNDDDYQIRKTAANALSSLPGVVAEPDPSRPKPHVRPLVGEDYLSDSPNPLAHVFTEKGEFWIELYADMAPFHVKSFITLAREGIYRNLKFHRVVSNFVVQGFDPRGDGWGRNNIVLRDEINRVAFTRGTVGMPNSGPDSGGCQIFITHCPTPHLDGRYTVFGRIIKGMNVVDALQVGDRVLKVIIEE